MAQPEKYWFPKYLARFYLPLPDPLSVNPDYTYIRTKPTTPWDAAEMESSDSVLQVHGNEWLNDLNPVRDFSESEGDTAAEIPMRGRVGNPFGHTFLSTVRITSGYTTGFPYPAYHYALSAARRSAGLPDHDLTDDDLPEFQIDYSVAEVIVPLQSDDDEAHTNQALHAALEAVRNVQRAICSIKSYPYRLITRETSPPTTIYEVGEVCADSVSRGFPVRSWTTKSLHLNTNFWSFTRRDWLTNDEHGALDEALYQSIQGHPALSYLDFRREAEVALERDGDYRAAVVWAASAAESVLDTLLQLMMWESGRQPERCIQEFNKVAITRRVATEFEKRLGGTWDFESENPVAEWKTHVADIRNRVVHSGHEPNYDAGRLSIRTVDLLVRHVCDLLGAKLERFPRTAFLTMGDKGLAKRGLSGKFREIEGKIYGPDWTETFVRWQSTHQQLLESDRNPQGTGAQVIFVFGRAYRGYWVLADARTGQATRFDVDESSILPDLMASLIEVLNRPPMTEDERAGWIKVDTPIVVKKLRPPWREAYQLIPGQGVMVKGDDIADKEFTWRPTQSPKAPQPEPPTT